VRGPGVVDRLRVVHPDPGPASAHRLSDRECRGVPHVVAAGLEGCPQDRHVTVLEAPAHDISVPEKRPGAAPRVSSSIFTKAKIRFSPTTRPGIRTAVSAPSCRTKTA
jgi:hypothetical protein